ncbi:MAG: chitobiase/beta-hexosaminidase C-terminal domain-containing protein, partial [Christensenellaceae bacterium]
MKAFFKSFASAGLAVLFGVGTLGGTAALAEMSEHRGENVPEEIKTENVALGKEVTFRSLMDMNETLTMYSYFPNNGGIDGTGCYDISAGGNVMTDGVNSEWGGYTVNSTWAGVRGWAYLDLGKSYDISAVKVHMLAAWCFMDVVVQVSDDALFQKDVATIFSVCDTLSSEGTTVYDGGKVGCTEETKGETGWNGREGVDSKQAEGNIFSCNVSARYVRFTNNCGTPEQNGGADENTAISEIEVYARTSGLAAPKASVESGTYESLETVELTSSYADAKIYYTLDGSYPTEESALYEGPVDLSGKTGAVALRAIAVVDGKQSYPADYQYKVVEGAYGNQALGKEITFRSLTDMNEVLTMYNYFPDGQGIDGTGCYDISTKGNVITDGQNTDWMGFNVNSTAANVQGWAF